MAMTWFQDFTLDDGRKVQVEWGYSRGEVSVESILDENGGNLEVAHIPAADWERFDELVLALDPFPPHEPYEP